MMEPIRSQQGEVRHIEIIWDAALPDSSPENRDSEKFPLV
jgi:hypothetical protein